MGPPPVSVQPAVQGQPAHIYHLASLVRGAACVTGQRVGSAQDSGSWPWPSSEIFALAGGVGGHGFQPVSLDAGKEELSGCSCSGQVGRVAMGLCVHVGDQSQSGGVGG